jgi:TonB family protein
MGRRGLGFLTAMALACGALCLAQPTTAATRRPMPRAPDTCNSVITKPVWASLPTAGDVLRAYPQWSLDRRRSATIRMDCMVTPEQGRLERCRVFTPGPEATEFGEAALSLTPKFRLDASVFDGSGAQCGHVNIAVVFAPPDTPNTPSPQGSVSVVTNPDWLRRPSPADLEHYYPPEARRQNLAGLVRLHCRITEAGSLENCRVITEQPPGAGFGAGALKLIPLFQMKPTTLRGESVAGASVTIPVVFGTLPDTLRPYRALAQPPLTRTAPTPKVGLGPPSCTN